jgi:hypothetical protein
MSYTVYKLNASLSPAFSDYMVKLKTFETSLDAESFAKEYSRVNKCITTVDEPHHSALEKNHG